MSAHSNQLVRLDINRPAEGSDERLFGLDAKLLGEHMVRIGEPVWRGRQLAEAMYRQWVADVASITPLPKALRDKLTAEGWGIGRPQILQTFVSSDGTERYLVACPGPDPIGFASAQTVETVWMPDGDDGEAGDGSEAGDSATAGEDRRPQSDPQTGPQTSRWRRATICVSSQIGCAVNCQFCLTAKLGLQRNLTAGEIAGQVVSVLDRQKVEIGKDRVNLVFMGMGEPFLNYENWMGAVRLLVDEVGISPQRMTVSTSGIVPGIERFAEEPPEVRPKLAISLNAPNDAVRSEVMPINRKWPIESVVDAVRQVRLRPRERVTFEYVLLGGITDQPEHAREVARLVKRCGLPAKVNLIAWNPGPGVPYQMPETSAVERFRRTLSDAGASVYLRRPRGRDIYAACGQLKRTVEAASPEIEALNRSPASK